jgi:hypothetical protein
MLIEFIHEIVFIVFRDIVSIARLFTQKEKWKIVRSLTSKCYHETNTLSEKISFEHLYIIFTKEYDKIRKSHAMFLYLSHDISELDRAYFLELFPKNSRY